MKRLSRLLLPFALATAALFPHQALAGGYVNVSVQESPNGSGAVYGGGSYATGDEVYLGASPANGYHFSHWEVENLDTHEIIYTLYESIAHFSTEHLTDVDLSATAYFHKLTHIELNYPTCTEPGNREYYYCYECGACFRPDTGEEIDYWNDVLIEAYGHDMTLVYGYPCTCTIDGVREHYHCTECDRRFWDEEGDYPVNGSDHVIPARGHQNWRPWQTATEATCTSEGFEERYCFDCDNTEPGGYESRPIPKTGHSWREVAYKAPTCTGKGNEAYAICTRCGTIVESVSNMRTLGGIPELPASGHDWGSWQVTTTPTCIQNGVETRTCANNGSHVETRTIPATGHDWDEGTVAVEPTETSAGVRVHRCKNDPTHTWNEPIPKLDKKTDPSDRDTGGSNPSTGPSSTPGNPTANTSTTTVPEPIDGPGFPWPLVIAGVIGALAVIGLVGMLVAKKQKEADS